MEHGRAGYGNIPEDTAALKHPQGVRLLGARQKGDPEAKFWACILFLPTLPLWGFAGPSASSAVCSVPAHSSEEAELGQSPACTFWFLE